MIGRLAELKCGSSAGKVTEEEAGKEVKITLGKTSMSDWTV